MNIFQYQNRLPNRVRRRAYWTKSIALLIWLITLLTGVHAAEKTEQTQALDQPQTSALRPAFHVDLNLLSQNNTMSEESWLEVRGYQVLLLKHSASAIQNRGDIVLFHAQGENPDHQRLVQPIAKQLANLGWQVWIPALPREDYPEQNALTALVEPANPSSTEEATRNETQSPQTDNQQLAATNNDHAGFFSNASDYQSFISELAEQVIQTIPISDDPLVLLGNQNTAYWILEKASISSKVNYVVLLGPEIPPIENSELNKRVILQTHPLFIFYESTESPTVFESVMRRNVWPNPEQRTDYHLFGNKIQPENDSIARAISGWIAPSVQSKRSF